MVEPGGLRAKYRDGARHQCVLFYDGTCVATLWTADVPDAGSSFLMVGNGLCVLKIFAKPPVESRAATNQKRKLWYSLLWVVMLARRFARQFMS